MLRLLFRGLLQRLLRALERGLFWGLGPPPPSGESLPKEAINDKR